MAPSLDADTAALRARVLADESVPEPVRRALERGAPLESIRLDAQGRWWHRGVPVDHPGIAALFTRSVDRTDGGTWVLRIPPYTYPIEVEDTPYQVVRAAVLSDSGEVAVTLSDGSAERIPPEALHYEGPGRLVARVKDNRLTARFGRQAYHEVLAHLDERDGAYVLVLGERLLLLEPAP